MLQPALRHSGAAIALLGTMLEWGLKRGLRLAVCHCAPRLVPLYRRLGMKPTGTVWHDEHVGEQHGLYMAREDVALLRGLRRQGQPGTAPAQSVPDAPAP
jgi:hypothetical protein